MIGSINDEILHADELAAAILIYLHEHYQGKIRERYETEESGDAYAMLKEISIQRKCFLKGEEPDLLRTSRIIVDDFRGGRLGRITLESPEEWK